jgi:hypothetical protein
MSVGQLYSLFVLNQEQKVSTDDSPKRQ